MPFNWGGAGSGAMSGASTGAMFGPWGAAAGGVAGGLMGGFMGGDSSDPYKDAMKQYEEWAKKGEAAQNPFLGFGERGMPGYERWLQGMQDPSGFINNLMGKYNESPWAKYQKEQALRASGNQGSASGLNGSTPMAQFNQQNAQNISSQDMNSWLQNVLGINTEYGAGLSHQIGVGQHAADQLTSMYGDMGRQMGEGAYGAGTQQNKDRASAFASAGDIADRWRQGSYSQGKSLWGGNGQ